MIWETKMTINFINLFEKAYFDYSKLIFLGIWFLSWLFFTDQISFVENIGESLVYALFISLVFYLLILPIFLGMIVLATNGIPQISRFFSTFWTKLFNNRH